MQASEVSTLGSRERGHVGMEMHYQHLNFSWAGTACRGMMTDEPLLDILRRNVLFQIKNNIYRVLTVYSKTYSQKMARSHFSSNGPPAQVHY
jgi:hypothetical protein